MKYLIIAVGVGLLTPASLFAQEHDKSGQDPAAYVTGLGGFTRSLGSTTGNVLVQGGVRLAPHLMAFGDLGRFGDLRGDLQPTLDATTAALAANQDLTVTGDGTLPAWYSVGGLRVSIPTKSPVQPYVLGGLGVARLDPQAQFTFSSGTMPDGSTPDPGTDVTTAIASGGGFTAPPASSAFMYTLGGGVQLPMARHWMVDTGYRFSRIAADSTLSASALNAHGMTFGAGYRF